MSTLGCGEDMNGFMTNIFLYKPCIIALNFVMLIEYFTALPCTHGDLRLAGGWTIYEGIVEICLSGFWKSVCGSRWNANESTVVCRQLTGELDPSTKQFFAWEIGYAYNMQIMFT